MNRYAIILKIDGEYGEKQITRIEHAESPADALYFAAANLGLEYPGVPMKMLHIGPPPEDIERFEAVLTKAIADKMTSLLGGTKE
jgi:hypothetical protein